MKRNCLILLIVSLLILSGCAQPPPGSASFEKVQENLLLGIKGYKRAFDEMIRYGDIGKVPRSRSVSDNRASGGARWDVYLLFPQLSPF